MPDTDQTAKSATPVRGEFAESSKLWADYLKHLTTLSTGSIVLIATFLEKLFAQPQWKSAVIVALAGFLTCVLGSVVAFTSIAIGILFWERAEHSPDLIEKIGAVGLFSAWLGFVAGVIALTIFAMRNLLL